MPLLVVLVVLNGKEVVVMEMVMVKTM